MKNIHIHIHRRTCDDGGISHKFSESHTMSGWSRTYFHPNGDVEVTKTKPITRGQGLAYYVKGKDLSGRQLEKRFNAGAGANIEAKVAKHLLKHHGITDPNPLRRPATTDAESPTEAIEKYPDLHKRLSEAKTPGELSKIKRQIVKEDDDDRFKGGLHQGHFEALLAHHKARIGTKGPSVTQTSQSDILRRHALKITNSEGKARGRKLG